MTGPSTRSRRPSRRRVFSQNFLTDPKVAAAMVRLSGIGRHDLAIEIGPGSGMVTRALVRRAGRVLAYEIDPVFAARLHQRFESNPHVRCVNRDFLSTSPPEEEFRIVANIPYSRTGDIIDWCLRADTLASATLLTQLEYARKRTGDYGRWSQVTVGSWPRFDWLLGERVRREKFHPMPRVDSAILQLNRRPQPLLPIRALGEFQRFVRVGFTGVGGSLAASLRRRYGGRAVARACRQAEVDSRQVVAFVHPDQHLRLFTELHR